MLLQACQATSGSTEEFAKGMWYYCKLRAAGASILDGSMRRLRGSLARLLGSSRHLGQQVNVFIRERFVHPPSDGHMGSSGRQIFDTARCSHVSYCWGGCWRRRVADACMYGMTPLVDLAGPRKNIGDAFAIGPRRTETDFAKVRDPEKSLLMLSAIARATHHQSTGHCHQRCPATSPGSAAQLENVPVPPVVCRRPLAYRGGVVSVHRGIRGCVRGVPCSGFAASLDHRIAPCGQVLRWLARTSGCALSGA